MSMKNTTKAAIVSTLLIGAATAVGAGVNPLRMLSSMSSGVLKVWSTNERIQATDLNANFTELNTTKVGGGVTLTNADVASNAAIAHSKLATPALVPKAWAHVNATCDGAAAAGTACTIGDSSQVSSVTSNGTAGQYRVNLSYTPANANFAQLVTSHVANVHCVTTATATAAPHVIVRCYTDSTGAATNTAISILIMDS